MADLRDILYNRVTLVLQQLIVYFKVSKRIDIKCTPQKLFTVWWYC